MKKSHLETQLANDLYLMAEGEGWPRPEREWRFHKKRRWRFDFAWPEKRLAVEVQGGLFAGGAHTRGAQYRKDREKINNAILLGWRVLEITDREIDNGEALWLIEAALLA